MKKGIQSLQNMSDAQLVHLARKNNVRAFNALVQKHTPNLRIYLHHLLRNSTMEEEVIQIVWIIIFKELQKRQYNESGNFSHWLIKIAHLEAIREAKHEHKYIHPEKENIFEEQSSDEQEADEKEIQQERKQKVRKAIRTLEKQMRKIVILRIIKEMSFRDIATNLHITVGAATSAFTKAKKKLKLLLL